MVEIRNKTYTALGLLGITTDGQSNTQSKANKKFLI